MLFKIKATVKISLTQSYSPLSHMLSNMFSNAKLLLQIFLNILWEILMHWVRKWCTFNMPEKSLKWNWETNLLIRYRRYYDVAFSCIYSLDLKCSKIFWEESILNAVLCIKNVSIYERTTENLILFFLKNFYFFWSLEMVSWVKSTKQLSSW